MRNHIGKVLFITLALLFVLPSPSISTPIDEGADLDKALKDCLGKDTSFDKRVACLDKALDACIDKNPSTGGQTQCIDRAYKLWDKELNKTYNELTSNLSAKEAKALKTSQLEWLKYRDTEFKFIDELYSYEKGSMNVTFN